MAKKETRLKEITINRMLGYKITISKEAYEVHFDDTPENRLAVSAIFDQILNDLILGVRTTNVYTPKEKKAKADRLERLRKLKLEVVNSMAEVAEYLLETKNPEDYENEGKKSKIVKATEEEVKKIILPK